MFVNADAYESPFADPVSSVGLLNAVKVPAVEAKPYALTWALAAGAMNSAAAKPSIPLRHRDVRRCVIVLVGFVFLMLWELVNNEGLKGNMVMDERVF